ncbi:MAG: hypothetical protein B7Y55_01145 [Polynucleobacter sp. 35-46-207]|nr:MAG: hypothetical protein B7Y55_01145 [Polynucleobacter sp. 35-46-207]
MAVSFNPQLTTSPANSFRQSTQGYYQGSFLDDPSSRMYLSAGQIASSVTGPVYGGMAVTEGVPAPGSETLGNPLTLSTGVAGLNSVQQSVAGMTISYFRLGSNARIAVQCDSTLAAALDSGAINQQVLWDFTNQKLIAYTTGTALPVKVLSVNTNSQIVVNTAGVLTYATGAVAIIQL